VIQTDTSTHSRSGYLYLAVFTGGMTTMAAEMSASRLLGNVFGTSNLVWANVIGLILLYLTVGYFVGGRWADRSPHYQTFYRILIWAAFLDGFIPILARPVLNLAANAVVGVEAALALGSFITVLILFAIPITLLGCVSPFAIRLGVTDIKDAGKISGRMYAISTLGSLIGTFLPVLVLTPRVGTFQTFLIFAGILYGIGFWGLWRSGFKQAAMRTLWMPVVVAIPAAMILNGPLRDPMKVKHSDGSVEQFSLLYEDESAYNYIQVQEDQNGYRYLYLNEGQGIHSQWHPDIVFYRRTWDFFLTAPYFNAPPYTPEDVDSMLIIGLAAGTIARQYIQVYGNIAIDGIEIDPDIVKAGAEFFDMNRDKMPSLTVYVEDGRYMLNHLDKTYRVIGIDAYRPPYIPWHLTTVEFFQEVRDHLTPDGAVAINVGRTDTDRRLVDALTATMLNVFPSVHAMDVPGAYNTILVATAQPTSDDNLRINLANLPADANPMLRAVLQMGTESLVPVMASDVVFTDNHAPVETMVDSLVLNFLLSGESEQLKGGN
jgi:spermidine synthase